MNVEKLLQLIPEQELAFLSAETNVNHQTKKLFGAVVFKLLLFSMFNSNKVSYRVMEKIISSASFTHFLGEKKDTKFNSIRDRICTINPIFFEQLFHKIFAIYNQHLQEEKALIKVDSTYVAIASKLVSWSMHNGRKDTLKKHIKYSVSLKGILPCGVQVFTDKKYISEDLALSKSIVENMFTNESIVVFDRGLSSRKKLDELSKENIGFVTRIAPNYAVKIIESNQLKNELETATLFIQEEIVVKLRATDKSWTKGNYRMIKAIKKIEPRKNRFSNQQF